MQPGGSCAESIGADAALRKHPHAGRCAGLISYIRAVAIAYEPAGDGLRAQISESAAIALGSIRCKAAPFIARITGSQPPLRSQLTPQERGSMLRASDAFSRGLPFCHRLGPPRQSDLARIAKTAGSSGAVSICRTAGRKGETRSWPPP